MLAARSTLEHERLYVFSDAPSGLTGAIAIHSTALGPAMGGLRLRRYPGLEDGVHDALRLARAMSLKNAAAGLDLGGGKAVVLDDGLWVDPQVRAERMRAVGRIIDELGGRYITAEDLGTTPDDMEQIASCTRFVAGRPAEMGGAGDPSPLTAHTVMAAIESAAAQHLETDDLSGVRVGVQGAGHVGAYLTEMLCRAGADVIVADAVAERAAEVALRTGARAVDSAGFVTRRFDVFAPCAIGEVIGRTIVPKLRCSIIAGAANNPLADSGLVEDVADAGILYVPDFLANCGGIIHVGGEALGLVPTAVAKLLEEATRRTAHVLSEAADSGRSPWSVAVDLADARIARGRVPNLQEAA